ncbi:hypothetical protein EDB85DRAFT_2280301, partial [Lactarius pseudohatsudake]
MLRAQAQAFDQSQIAREELTKWLDPTVNVLYAFSAALGEGIGLTFPPAKAIFAGIGVLLQAVRTSALAKMLCRPVWPHGILFMRLQKYIDIRPTAAMTDIIVKIMVEVISVLGIVTKEIRQDNVDGIDGRVRSVDDKVESVTHGINENRVAIQQMVNQVSDLTRNELRKDLRKWIAPPDPSVNYNTASDVHHEGTAAWCTKGHPRKLEDIWFFVMDSRKTWLWEEYSQLRDHPRHQTHVQRRIGFLGLFLLRFQGQSKAGFPRSIILSSCPTLRSIRYFCDTLFSLYSAHKQGSEQPTTDSLSQCLKHMLTTAELVPISCPG